MKLLDWITARIPKVGDPRGRSAASPASLAAGHRPLGPAPRLTAADDPGQRKWTLRAGWLIDGSGGPIRPNIRLDIREGTFQAVEDAHAAPAAPCARGGDCDYDFSASTVLPGLVDSHVHLAMTGSADEALRTRLRQAPAEAVLRAIHENLREGLRHGVVCVRDGGGARGTALRFSKGAQGRAVQPVRIVAAGRAWHGAGRYGRRIGRPPLAGKSLAESILIDDSPCDLIKVVNSGVNSLSEFGRRTAPHFSLAEMTAAVQAAERRGLQVMAHANGEEPVRIAVLAGCRSIEHGFFMGSENLARLAEKSVAWVPTVVPMQAYADHLAQADRRADVARRTVEHQLEQLHQARRLNVMVALGTDSGSPGVDHGLAVLAEMKFLMAAGFSLAEAVRCASFNGARLTGGDFGLVAAGRPATFIVVPGGPFELPDSIRRIQAVYVDGQPVVAAG
jgi:imidazolonepropionase-like amidohydrolase